MTAATVEFRAGRCLIDAGSSQARVSDLRRAGLSINAIAEGAGVSPEAVRKLVAGYRRRVAVETAQALLLFDPSAHADLLVPSLGTCRRLRALMANGWDSATMAALLGVTDKQVREWRRRSGPKVRNRVHLTVASLYRRIGDRRGPNDLARGRALRLGYAPPIHWDDDGDLDNPLSHPKQFQPHSTPRSRKAA